MSGIIEVDGAWLALREPEDARARSEGLAATASALLRPGPIVVHDLGSGTGSMMRWLAPMLPGPQRWVLHDWNPVLTEQAASGPAPRDRDGAAVEILARGGELAALRPGDLAEASLVTASALLDVLTAEEVHAVVDACLAAGCPALLSLSVTGEIRLDPVDPIDAVIGHAFNAHQRRLVAGRRLLGPGAAAVAAGRFAAAGWRVRTEETCWRLDGRDAPLLGQWLDGWIDAALELRPDLEPDGTRYRHARAAQLHDGALSAVVVHADLLAWPR